MASAPAPTSSPKKTGAKEKVGPTLSTSTSSFEPLDPHDPQLNHLASLMFNKTADWITCELETTSDEYKLIHQMNKVTASKYSDMQQISGNIAKGVTQLEDKYQELQPYLDQIDQIDESVERLFQAAVKLDSYSKRLENKYKELEKRNK